MRKLAALAPLISSHRVWLNRSESSLESRPRFYPARAGKGYCLGEVTVFGEEAHSAHPQKGRSAIYRAARLITAIEEYGSVLAQEQNPFFSPGFTTLNIGTIQGGTAKNIIPGQCKFQLEWRPIPGQAPDTIAAAISSIAELSVSPIRASAMSFRSFVGNLASKPNWIAILFDRSKQSPGERRPPYHSARKQASWLLLRKKLLCSDQEICGQLTAAVNVYLWSNLMKR